MGLSLKFCSWTVFSVCTLVLGTALAEDEVPFGPEFTFTNKPLMLESAATLGKLAELPLNRAAKQRMVAAIRKSCGDCTIEEIENPKGALRNGGLAEKYHRSIKHYVVRYPNGFWFKVMADPGVVEVIAKPSTRPEMAAMREQIQRDLFGAAKAAGLYPTDLAGGGHINIGLIQAFQGDPLKFRNFLVDQVNNPEFNEQQIDGSLGIHDLPPEKQAEFERAIRDFDSGRIKTMDGLARRIREKVYPEGRHGRYVALALSYIGPKGRFGEPQPPEAERVELRGIRAQYTFDEYLLELELLEAKIKEIGKRTTPIPLEIPSADRTDAERVERFQAWIESSGLDPARFTELAVPRPHYLDSRLKMCAKAFGFIQ